MIVQLDCVFVHSCIGWGTEKLSDDSTYRKFSESCLYGKYIKHHGNIDIGQVDLLTKGVRAHTNLSSGEKKSSLPTNLASTLVTQLLGSFLLEILGTEYRP